MIKTTRTNPREHNTLLEVLHQEVEAVLLEVILAQLHLVVCKKTVHVTGNGGVQYFIKPIV